MDKLIIAVASAFFIFSFSACVTERSAVASKKDLTPAPGICTSEELTRIGGKRVWRCSGETAFFYEAGMAIDADGAPNAYHSDGSRALCYLANAGKPGNWWALVTDNGRRDGNPLVQDEDDPYPGFYISMTSLEDKTKDVDDPSRYVNATQIPYIVLPGGMAGGAGLGDYAVVINRKNGRLAYAIFADVGPRHKIGEGSIALARELDINFSSKRGGVGSGIRYLVFPGSGDGQPKSAETIEREGERLFREWGGMDRLNKAVP